MIPEVHRPPADRLGARSTDHRRFSKKILLKTKNAMVKQYSKLFAMDGVRLKLTSDAVKAICGQGHRAEDRRAPRRCGSIMGKT